MTHSLSASRLESAQIFEKHKAPSRKDSTSSPIFEQQKYIIKNLESSIQSMASANEYDLSKKTLKLAEIKQLVKSIDQPTLTLPLATYVKPPKNPKLPLGGSDKPPREEPTKWGDSFCRLVENNTNNLPPRILPHLPEDSFCRKALTCIPLVGIYFFHKNVDSLTEKMNGVQDPAERANYIRIKNHYKNADLLQKALSVAIIVSAVALAALLTVPAIAPGIIPVAVAIGAIAISFYSIYQNKQFQDQNRIP